MPSLGRPESPKTKAAARQQAAVRAFMSEYGMSRAEMARRTQMAPSSVGRALRDEPARDTPSLQKLFNYISGSPEKRAKMGASDLARLIQKPVGADGAAAAIILRAVADLLDQLRPAD